MTAPVDKTIDLKRYLRVVWRRKGIAVLCAVTVLCATLVILQLVPREYESQATLIMERSQALSVDLTRLMGGIMQSPSGFNVDQERMAMVVGRIRSRPFLERVVRVLKMNEDPVVRAKAEAARKLHPGLSVDEMATRILVGNLQSRISVASAGIGMYRVTVADYSPENAQLLARWITELFVDMSNQRTIERISVGREFGAEQLKIYEEQLRRSETALQRYRQSMIGRSLVPGLVRGDNLAAAEALERRLGEEASAARIRLRSCSESLTKHGIAMDQGAIEDDPEVRSLADGLRSAVKADLGDRLAGPAAEIGGWPPQGNYGALRGGFLRQVEAVTARHFPEASSEASHAVARYLFARVDLDVLQSASGLVGDAIADYRRQAESTPGGEIGLARLEADVETNRRLLQSFQAQMVASDVSQAVEVTKLGSQIEVLDPASLPLAASRPNRLKILFFALFLGPLMGIVLAFLVDTIDPTLRSLEDFANIMPEPVLGTTPLLDRLVPNQGWLRRRWVPATLAAVIFLTAVLVTARSSVFRAVATSSHPVRIINPETAPIENAR